MRFFQQVIALLATLLFSVSVAQDGSYDATVYLTSTVYLVNTVTLSTSPTASVANTTSTIAPSIPTGTGGVAPYPSSGSNSTIAPSGTAPSPSGPEPTEEFTGAASSLNVNAIVAAAAAGIVYLAL